MSTTITTRAVNRQKFKNYLKKADQFYIAMNLSYENKIWNACVVNAIHCTISLADALTVFYLGFRYAGTKHHDVIQLLQKLELDKKDLNKKIQQISTLISIKTLAEYEDRLMTEKDAANAKKICERIYYWVHEKLK